MLCKTKFKKEEIKEEEREDEEEEKEQEDQGRKKEESDNDEKKKKLKRVFHLPRRKPFFKYRFLKIFFLRLHKKV